MNNITLIGMPGVGKSNDRCCAGKGVGVSVPRFRSSLRNRRIGAVQIIEKKDMRDSDVENRVIAFQ